MNGLSCGGKKFAGRQYRPGEYPHLKVCYRLKPVNPVAIPNESLTCSTRFAFDSSILSSALETLLDSPIRALDAASSFSFDGRRKTFEVLS